MKRDVLSKVDEPLGNGWTRRTKQVRVGIWPFRRTDTRTELIPGGPVVGGADASDVADAFRKFGHQHTTSTSKWNVASYDPGAQVLGEPDVPADFVPPTPSLGGPPIRDWPVATSQLPDPKSKELWDPKCDNCGERVASETRGRYGGVDHSYWVHVHDGKEPCTFFYGPDGPHHQPKESPMTDDNKIYDLTVPGLAEEGLRILANVSNSNWRIRDAARAKLAEIYAERAATTPPVISLEVADWPKMIRETLCVAQTVGGIRTQDSRHREHIDRIQRLIDACDVHRPLGPDGKHGNLHTPTCGCESDDGGVA